MSLPLFPPPNPEAQPDSSKPIHTNVKVNIESQTNPSLAPKTNSQGQPEANRPQPDDTSSLVAALPAGVEIVLSNPTVAANPPNEPLVTIKS